MTNLQEKIDVLKTKIHAYTPEKINYFIGKKINNYTILEYQSFNKKWKCLCDCGEIWNVSSGQFNRGKGKACPKCKAKNNSITKTLPNNLMLKKQIFIRYKNNAQKTNRIFELSYDYFWEIASKNCFYCKTPPELHSIKSHGKPREIHHNGIDRKNNHIGYTKENSVPCCSLCNISKNNHSLLEWKEWIKRISNNLENF